MNSTSDDFAIHLDSQGKGFISSNREGDTDHIYEIELEEVDARWVIALKNCSDDPVVGLPTKLMDSQGQLVESITSDSAGILRFSGGTNTRYQLVFEGSQRHRAFKIDLSAAREGTWTQLRRTSADQCGLGMGAIPGTMNHCGIHRHCFQLVCCIQVAIVHSLQNC